VGAGERAARLPALDGLRGVAILLVLLYHFVLVGIGGTEVPSFLRPQAHEPANWADRALVSVMGTGWTGVDLFFVLSGFLITRILLDTKESGQYFKSFYSRRALRILPVYVAFLGFMVLLLPQLPGLTDPAEVARLREHQWEFWAFLINITGSVDPFIPRGEFGTGHLWSLAVEEQFYLIWPLIVLLLGRKALAAFCVACIVAAPLFRFVLLQGGIPELENPFAAYTLMPSRMDTLALGGLLAIVARDAGSLRQASRWALPVGVVAALAVAVLFLSDRGMRAFDERVQIFGYTGIALLFAALLTAVVSGMSLGLQDVLVQPVLGFFGRYSYALYVVHLEVAHQLARLANNRGGLPVVLGSNIPAALGFTAAGIGISIGIAWLSWHVIERHFLKLKRFVPYREDPSPLPIPSDTLVPAAIERG
jgi:peptidoglycan/LPS O-acetylase OafA/YrhL